MVQLLLKRKILSRAERYTKIAACDGGHKEEREREREREFVPRTRALHHHNYIGLRFRTSGRTKAGVGFQDSKEVRKEGRSLHCAADFTLLACVGGTGDETATTTSSL
jgi:hypothetical protein